VQVDDKIKIFFPQFPEQGGHIILQQVDSGEVRIGADHRVEFFLGQEMDLSLGQLLLQAADHWSGKHNIADGAEAYDEDFLQTDII